MRAAAGSAPAVDWATGKPVRETLDTQDGDAPPPDLSITVSQADPEYGSISVYLDSCKALSVLPSKVAVEQFGSRDFKLPMFGLGVGAAEAIGAGSAAAHGFALWSFCDSVCLSIAYVCINQKHRAAYCLICHKPLLASFILLYGVREKPQCPLCSDSCSWRKPRLTAP